VFKLDGQEWKLNLRYSFHCRAPAPNFLETCAVVFWWSTRSECHTDRRTDRHDFLITQITRTFCRYICCNEALQRHAPFLGALSYKLRVSDPTLAVLLATGSNWPIFVKLGLNVMLLSPLEGACCSTWRTGRENKHKKGREKYKT
jgi:hypothetical protein